MSNVFKIMIATDNHLGYQEKDLLRRDDPYLALEEVLRESEALQCDFLLLGGDLFHDHSPSKYTLNRTLQLFYKYTVGCPRLAFTTLSRDRELNYLSQSIPIKLPVFLIHGNHDDQAADVNISAINILHSARLLNYLTSEQEDETVHIKPVVLQKGDTKIAIYGIGNMKEERLNRLLREEKVEFERVENEQATIFVLVLHQNRFKGHGQGPTAKNSIMDSAFPRFFDLVIWGHEHDSFTVARKAENREYSIYQPGSTVATSLTEGEARPKHMFLLEIKCLGYKVTPIPLKFTRPILFKSVELKDLCVDSNDPEGRLTALFEEMLTQADPLKLAPPLVRIKVEVTGYEDFRIFYLNSSFSEKTANKDVVMVWKRGTVEKKEEKQEIKFGGIFDDIFKAMEGGLREAGNEFKVLSVAQFGDRVRAFVEKRDLKSFEEYFNGKVQVACRKIREKVREFDEELIRKRINEMDVSGEEASFKRIQAVNINEMAKDRGNM